MTHKDNEWFRGKPQVAGRYYWGGNGDSPNAQHADSLGDLDPIPPVPLPRPEVVDTPVLVRDRDSDPWRRRYLAGWTKDGRIKAWSLGCTSWSSDGDEHIQTWSHWKLPEET